MENDKRMRREIANSNERRRMQSINAGFQSLRTLLPHHEGEKLSKAAILQQTSEYICQLQHDKEELFSQISQFKRQVSVQNGENIVACNGSTGSPSSSSSANHSEVYSTPHSPNAEILPPITKRRRTIDGSMESADEGFGNMSPDHSPVGEDAAQRELSELRREAIDLRIQLDRERRHRITMEEHINLLQGQQQQSTQQPNYFADVKPERVPVPAVVESETSPTSSYLRHMEENPRAGVVRNNLETIVEAIRHLEGDAFGESFCKFSQISSPPSASPPRAMDICSSPQVSQSDSDSQSMMEMSIPSMVSHQLAHSFSGNNYTSSGISASVSTATSLKHHVLSRIARSSEIDDEPINLQFRPVISRCSSPFIAPLQHIHNTFNIQHQRPGVIVVKHS